MDLMQRLSEYRSEEERLRWEGTFADYFELVKQNPRIARLSHGRIFDMIMDAGIEPHEELELPNYRFFEGELFGLEKPLQQIAEYFNSAAQRSRSVSASCC
jgi:serine protein kinase